MPPLLFLFSSTGDTRTFDQRFRMHSCDSSFFIEFPKNHLSVSLNSPSGAGAIAAPRDAKQG
jgi:hypothetical protein